MVINKNFTLFSNIGKRKQYYFVHEVGTVSYILRKSGITTEFYSKVLITYFSDWFEGVRAAACLAMITNLAGAVTLALFSFVPSISQKITKLSSITLLGLAGTCLI